jgi:glucose/arabinose dehydrogenase
MTRRSAPRILVVAMAAAFAAGACGADPSSTPARTGSATPSGTSDPGTTPGPGATSGATSVPGNRPDLDSIEITLEPFASVGGGPLAMTAPDDGTGRLFVAAQDGRIWVVGRDGTVTGEPMVSLGSRIRTGGEQGLLGIATHPTFPTDPRVFVNYTNTDGDTVVASLALDPGNPDRLDAGSHEQLLFVDQPAGNHNGGAVVFGSDGYLYLSLGDGGGGGDPQDNGQNRDSLLGKILRIDVDGGDPYVVPPDNPFASGGGAAEVWHWGLRNPWRMSFDRDTGDLWIGDVGQGALEEVDVSRAGVSGLNFGWNVMEGSRCYGSGSCATDGLTLPVTEYGRDLGCTVIGGYVYRGARYPFLVGAYLFADYCTGHIFAIDAAADGPVPPITVGTTDGRISAFGEDADGELYVVALQGDIRRVIATQR